MLRIFKSIRYAINGIIYNIKTQNNFRIHILGFIFMILSAYFLQFNKMELALCIVISALVFSAELFNTAIESLVDLSTKEYNELAKIAKDCAAAAVLILAILAVVVWAMIVYGKIN